jgi:hypothetical protein
VILGRLHLPLFLFALTIAVVLKVAVNQTQQLAETTVTAQVRYEMASNENMILDPLPEVKVRLRGPRNEIAFLNPFSVEVEVSLEEGEEGLIDITEERLNVRMPGDFEVISIEPNQFSLTVEPQVRRMLRVRIDLTGEPAAGAYNEAPYARPAMSEAMGPISLIEPLTELVATLSLDGHALSFEATVSIDSPDPLVRIDPRQVVVHVPMKVPESSTFESFPEEPIQ